MSEIKNNIRECLIDQLSKSLKIQDLLITISDIVEMERGGKGKDYIHCPCKLLAEKLRDITEPEIECLLRNLNEEGTSLLVEVIANPEPYADQFHPLPEEISFPLNWNIWRIFLEKIDSTQFNIFFEKLDDQTIKKLFQDDSGHSGIQTGIIEILWDDNLERVCKIVSEK